jgi:hypothetical protein
MSAAMQKRGAIIITAPSNERRLARTRMRKPHSADPPWAIFEAAIFPVFGACYRPDKREFSRCYRPVILPRPA